MPRAKSLSHYPARYGEIVEACAIRGATATLSAADAQAVMGMSTDPVHAVAKLRGHFYAYLGVLRREGERLAKAGAISPGSQEIIDRAAQSFRVVCTIMDDPVRLVFANRDKSWQAQAFDKIVIEEESGARPVGGLDTIADRLMQIKPTGEGK